MKFTSLSLAAILCCASVVTAEAKGEIFLQGRQVVIKKGEVIKGDVRISADEVLIAGSIEGNARISGREVVVTGKVSGDVKISTNSMVVSGEIGGNAEMQLHELVIEEGGLVVGNIYCNGHSIKIEDTVKGSVRGRFATAFLSGQVEGDLELRGAKLTATDSASVGGDVIIAKHDRHKISKKAKLEILK